MANGQRADVGPRGAVRGIAVVVAASGAYLAALWLLSLLTSVLLRMA
jgi:hypothetical protein